MNARTARVPLWPISVPQRVGFSNNVPLTVVPQRVPFLWICAIKGMNLGPHFVPVRVRFHKFCVTEGAVLTGYTFSG